MRALSSQFTQSFNLWGKWKWTLRESESPKCEIKRLFQVFLQPRSTPTQFQLQSHNSSLPVKISDRTSQHFFFVKRCSIGKWWVLKLEAKKIFFTSNRSFKTLSCCSWSISYSGSRVEQNWKCPSDLHEADMCNDNTWLCSFTNKQMFCDCGMELFQTREPRQYVPISV